MRKPIEDGGNSRRVRKIEPSQLTSHRPDEETALPATQDGRLTLTKLHTLVGKTAKRLGFFSRWMPGVVRKQTRSSARSLG